MRQKFEKFEWEVIYQSESHTTARAMVYGGWIVLTQILAGKNHSSSQTFVNDPQHKWALINTPGMPVPEPEPSLL